MRSASTGASQPIARRCPGQVRIKDGPGVHILNEFREVTGLNHPDTYVVSMFDQHHVADSILDWDVACDAGVKLELINNSVNLLCSFGHNHRRESFRRDSPWHPFIAELDGYIFTDYRVGYRRTVAVYRENWMEMNCVGVRGDKGQVAQLIGKPTLLFLSLIHI